MSGDNNELLQTLNMLNPYCAEAVMRAQMEIAAGRRHSTCNAAHFLSALMDDEQSDICLLLQDQGIDLDGVRRQLNAALDEIPSERVVENVSYGLDIFDLIREAWAYGSIVHGANGVRSGFLLVALRRLDPSGKKKRKTSPELYTVNVKRITDEYGALTESSTEAQSDGPVPGAKGVTEAPPKGAPGRGGNTALDLYTIDFTELAREGKLDPIVGRDAEIRQITDILTRRRQNNPIVIGEPGVGKTAVVEGFALKVHQGEVPPSLHGVSVRALDLGLLQAGAGVKGEFEKRLKQVIDAVKGDDVVLFIDEAHTLVGAGGQAGQGDAANLLKPALARGELRTIAATTWAEYKKYFEKDAALTRRFQPIKIEEPSEEAAIDMIRVLTDKLEEHHHVRIMNEGIEQAVRLSSRYVSGRQLPDKAISVLDTACARVALSQHAKPGLLEDAQQKLAALELDLSILRREAATGVDHGEVIAEREAAARACEDEVASLTEQRDAEIARVTTIKEKLDQLDPKAEGAADVDRDAALAELKEAQSRLLELQGEHPMVHAVVDGQVVGEVVSAWTGVPLGRMQRDDIESTRLLREKMEERVVGQGHGLEIISRKLQMARTNLTDPKKPVGVFLLVGPSGVGKTETALTIAETLYGGEQNLTVINMSEFKEEHKVSLLMGSPPGYVGYGEGGVLTEAVRRRPYSVVLLDEMEKAHPGIQDIFYQVFDKGMLKDGTGRDIDFKNTVIIMTSNAASEKISKLCEDPDTRPSADKLGEMIRPDLMEYFKPAFMGRLDVIPYFPLSTDILEMIATLMLKKVGRRVREHHKAEFTWSDAVVSAIAERCTSPETGARNVDLILSRTLLPQLAMDFLNLMGEGKTVREVRAEWDAEKERFYFELKAQEEAEAAEEA